MTPIPLEDIFNTLGKRYEKLKLCVQNHSNRKYEGLEPSRPMSIT